MRLSLIHISFCISVKDSISAASGEKPNLVLSAQAQDMEVVTPQALINIRPVVAAVKEFFGSSPLSQFIDVYKRQV